MYLVIFNKKLFSIFQKFYVEIQTQFNIFIRVLRNDNAKEYFSAPFTSLERRSHQNVWRLVLLIQMIN